MRKLGFTVAAAVAVAFTAAPACAVSVNFDSGSAVQNNSVVQQSFSSYSVGQLIGRNTYVFNSDVSVFGATIAVEPSTSVGKYAAVLGGGSYTYLLATAAPVLSFMVGSLDAYNSVTLTMVNTAAKVGSGISTLTYTGSQLGTLGADGRVTFATGSGTFLISGITFTSTANAFEFDTIATAAPEPATWAMMILGFGFAGMALRSSRRRGTLALA